MSKTALIEALKEMLRVIMLAIIPVLIVQLQEQSIDYLALFIVGAIALLRFIDKYLHTLGKETEKPGLTRGLTRF